MVFKTTEKQLLILEFHTPSSPWRRDDVTSTEPRHHVDLSNNTHDVIEDPDDTDATEEIHITHNEEPAWKLNECDVTYVLKEPRRRSKRRHHRVVYQRRVSD
jgi:hypothetical protein